MVVELKICERCGAFWLRPLHSGWIYCAPCVPIVRQMAAPQIELAGAGGAQ